MGSRGDNDSGRGKIDALACVLALTGRPRVEIAYSPGTVVLSWPALPLATAYRVYRAQEPWGAYQLRAVTSQPGYAEAVEGPRACYRVTAETEEQPRPQGPRP